MSKLWGSLHKPTVTFFILTGYKVGKKSDIMVMPVELLYRDEFLEGGESAENYAKRRIGDIIGKTVDEVSFPLGIRIIKVNTVLSLDGFRVCIAGGASGGKAIIASSFVPFIADSKIETYIKRLEVMTEKAKENVNFIYHPEYDKVTAEENTVLYDIYVKKLGETVYAKRPNNPLKVLTDGREKFVKLSPVEQAKALLNIHQVFGRIAGGCDLSAVGGVSKACATHISSNVSNWKKSYKDVRIIDASVSGLWEKQSGNLLDLL